MLNINIATTLIAYTSIIFIQLPNVISLIYLSFIIIQMVRQTPKRSAATSQQNEELLFLLSSIRSRENGLIFFLLSSQHYVIYKQQFLQKQKLGSQQIKQVIERVGGIALPQGQVRSFWIKLKSIMKVSMERVRTLGLLHQNLLQRYEQILKLIDRCYDGNSQISDYMLIQQLIKKRTIETLIATKQVFADHPSQDFGKIRSETFLKGQLRPSQAVSYSPVHRQPEQLASVQEVGRAKETTAKLRKREKGKSKGGLQSKKIQVSLCRYERNLADVMDLRIDYLIDRRKTQAENEAAIYDALFSRNISNHKVISNKISQKAVQMRRVQNQQRRNLSHSKINRKVEESAQEIEGGKVNESKKKLGRPKTSKQAKRTLLIKSTNARTDKIYQLIRLI